MARTYKTVGFSIPPAIAERIEQTAMARNMTRSELFREMFRVWERETCLDPDSDEAILRMAAEEKEKERRNQPPWRMTCDSSPRCGKTYRNRAKERGLTVTEDGEIVEIARV